MSLQRPTAKELLKHKVARSAGKNSTLLEIVNASSKSMSKSKPVLSSEIVPEKINRQYGRACMILDSGSLLLI